MIGFDMLFQNSCMQRSLDHHAAANNFILSVDPETAYTCFKLLKVTAMRFQFLTWLFLALPSLAFAAPEIGDPAPNFSLKGSDGNTYSLHELVGTSGIVIAFFPKAFTGG